MGHRGGSVPTAIGVKTRWWNRLPGGYDSGGWTMPDRSAKAHAASVSINRISTLTVWGKAGQRLTERELAKRGWERAKRQQLRAAALVDARRNWAAGKVAPWRITHALGDLDGPEVDRACGVEEPTVDHWELGIVYPTWSQLEALAALTGYPVAFFCKDDKPILASETSLAYHCKPSEITAADEEVTRRFLPEAIERTLHAEGVIS